MVMKIVSIEWNHIPQLHPSACCIGFFDGFHRGHQLLLEKTLALAKHKHLLSGVILFDPDPWLLFHPERKLDHLTPLEKRIKMIEAKGFDVIYILHFTQSFAALPTDAFHQLLAEMQVKFLVCGTDFRYGRQNRGTIATLKSQTSFVVVPIDPLMENGQAKISSSTIEKWVAEGKIEAANRLLGYQYSIDGIVEHGYKRGSELLQIPTANLKVVGDYVLPAAGVYAGFVKVEGQYYQAMINIGKNPTFKNEQKTIEAHLFDFDQDIYGKPVSFLFVQRLRKEMKFDSVEALKEQLLKDRERSKRLLANISIQDWS